MDPDGRARLNGQRSTRKSASGYRWDRFAKAVVDRYGGLCHICRHGGARQADHLVPETEQPDRAWRTEDFRPAHGAPGNPCPVCSDQMGKPCYCNQLRGQGSVDRARRIIAERIAGHRGGSPRNEEKPGIPEQVRDAGREWLPPAVS